MYKEILAKIYRALGRYDQAVETAKQALAANPNSLLSQLVLVSVGVICGDRTNESQLREKILALEPNFSLVQFAEGQPYSDGCFLKKWVSEFVSRLT